MRVTVSGMPEDPARGENPYRSPAANAAGAHDTHRRTSTNMADADSAGARVRATFMDATGPKAQVTGVSTTPRASSDVLASRLTPPGCDMAVEYSGSSPWARAWAGQAKNHRNSALSPQPQVVVDAGCADHTPHHTTRARPR